VEDIARDFVVSNVRQRGVGKGNAGRGEG
jgi:hypothetical protein